MKVMIVDDHRLFAEALQAALEDQGMDVVGVAHSARAAIEMGIRLRPDIVLMDLTLPDNHGTIAGAEILKTIPNTKVLAITARSDSHTVEKTMKAGFHGFLSKESNLAQLVNSVKSALDGQIVVPYRLTNDKGNGDSPERQAARLRANQLTEREREVLKLLCEGSSGEEIAGGLSVSPNTVRTHVQNILMKLQVHSRLEAVAFAVRHGVVDLPAGV